MYYVVMAAVSCIASLHVGRLHLGDHELQGPRTIRRQQCVASLQHVSTRMVSYLFRHQLMQRASIVPCVTSDRMSDLSSTYVKCDRVCSLLHLLFKHVQLLWLNNIRQKVIADSYKPTETEVTDLQ
jgi:hypothetical protein